MNVLATLKDILVKDYKAAGDLTPDTRLNDLGIDSLGLLELMFKIEDHFKVTIPGDPPADLATVQDVCNYIEALVAGQQGVKGSPSNAAVRP